MKATTLSEQIETDLATQSYIAISLTERLWQLLIENPHESIGLSPLCVSHGLSFHGCFARGNKGSYKITGTDDKVMKHQLKVLLCV